MNQNLTAEPEATVAPDFEKFFQIGAAKTLGNLAALAESGRSWAFDKEGAYENWQESFFDIGNWTPGFFTGMGVLSYLKTKEESYLEALALMDELYQRKLEEGAADTMHDLGFLYSPYAVALYQVTGKEEYRQLGLKAANLLAGRFIEEGNYIRAWGRMDELDTDYAGLAIIDCMMNLPLLYWASEETGESRFKELAIRHSDTTLKFFIREDSSVYHSYRFNSDGTPKGGDNYCGRGVESFWARGGAWAMYGFALGYKHTGRKDYLDASLRVARKWLSYLDDEVVPVWDYFLEEGAEPLRDSSAAAIAACAIQVLNGIGHADAGMLEAKTALLSRLCEEKYFNPDPKVRGLIRFGEVGNGVGKARYAYTSWGDYYFMEGLARELGIEVTWW